MVVLILLNLLMFYILKTFLNKVDLINRKKLFIWFLFGILFEFILLIIYRFNLFNLNRIVYYSDAETYWYNTLELIKYGKSEGYNSLYYYLCFILQKTSPFIWVGWNNIFNITCINFSVVLTICTFNNKNIVNKIKYLIIAVMFNPFIIYSLFRNLKDALFMLMVFITAYLLNYALEKGSRVFNVLLYFIFILLTYLFLLIRPWGFIIPIIGIIYFTICLIKKTKINIKNILKKNIALLFLAILIFIVAFVFLFQDIFATIKVWFPTVYHELSSRNIFVTLIGFFKFLFAPGPIRALLGSRYFVHYTDSGNIMCFLGQIMWWVSIIIITANVIISIQQKKVEIKKSTILSKFIFVIMLVYLCIYVIQYGGVAELRLRAVMYIFIYSVFFSNFDLHNYRDNKKIYNIVSLIFFFVFIGVTLIGM